MITIKRAVSVMLCLSLLTAGTLAAATTTAGASMTIDERLADLDLDTEDYPEGRVLVTLAAKSIPGSDLLAEGCVTDDDLVIEDVMDFGEAVDVARTSTEKKDFREKTLYVSVVTSDDLSTDELVEKLKNEDDVISVTPDYRLKKMTDDTIFNGQWALGGTDYKVLGGAPKGINYYDEKTASVSGSSVVCVVDDGIDYTHEDLKDVMWDNPYTSSGLLGTHGYDFVNGDEDPIPTYSDDDHGTHVAGIIAAQTDNQKGVAGVSASASLMALKVFDDRNDSSGLTSVILQAYEYIYQAMELGVNVSAINCSFGNDPSDRYTEPTSDRSVMNTVINKLGSLGALMVFAAGNESTNMDSYDKAFPYYIDRDYMVTVGAVSANDKFASYSNYGASTVDIMAPGSQILSTVPNDTFLPESYTASKRSSLCMLYKDFNSGISGVYTAKDILSSSSAINLSGSSEDFYGNGGSLVVRVNYSRSLSNTSGTFYIDVTDLNIDPSLGTYYISYDYAINDESSFDWSHESGKLSKSLLYGYKQKTYLKFSLPSMFGVTTSRLSGNSIYFDNLAISVVNPDSSEFGRYDYKAGTSMAAPVISGAIARLAALYPSDSAKIRKQKLLASIRKTDDLEGKCVTAGIVDVSRFDDADIAAIGADEVDETVSVKKVKLNKSSATLKAGKTLKLKATVTPSNATNKKVKWTTSNKKYATVSSKGVVKAKKKGIGHTVKITATAKDGSKKKATCKIKIKK